MALCWKKLHILEASVEMSAKQELIYTELSWHNAHKAWLQHEGLGGMSIGDSLNEMFCGAAVAAGALLRPDWETKKLPVRLGSGIRSPSLLAQ